MKQLCSGTSLRGRMALAMLALTLLFWALPRTTSAQDAPTREITDMLGRKVVLPAKISKVYGSSPPANHLLYAVAPDLMAGLSFPVSEADKRFLRPQTPSLPLLGAVMGQGRQFNPEEILKAKPDFVLAWVDRFGNASDTEARFAKIGLPVVIIRLDSLDDYPATLKFLGDLLGRGERAEALSSYVSAAITRVTEAVKSIPPEQRLRVYYTQTSDGLTTECDQSFHVEPIRMAGGDNVHHCQQTTHQGMEKVSLEQIIAYHPQLILTQDRNFAQSLADKPEWRNVDAVKSGRVVVIPRTPFNWVDRPPSFMRALGIQWLTNLFYPDRYPLDLKAETKAFYKLFLGVDVSDSDLDLILK